MTYEIAEPYSRPEDGPKQNILERDDVQVGTIRGANGREWRL